MGKRKERRLAAMSNAGRRVKLDLFAEPSEDLGGSSVQEEIDGEPKHLSGLPNSPSSPDIYVVCPRTCFQIVGFLLENLYLGQQPPNPLLLLGQYSDDELDEESDKRKEHDTLNGSLSDQDDQGKGPLSQTCKDTEADAGESLDTLKVNQSNAEKDSTPNSIQNLVDVDNKEDIYVTNESVKNDSTEPDPFAGASEVQVTQDVGSGWRIVMHEESNQYYYWNTETGETSWEVPTVLNQINQSTSHLKTPIVEDMEGKVYDNEPELDELVGGCKNKALKDKISDVSRSDFQSSLDAVDNCLTGGSLDHSGNSTRDLHADDDNKTGIDLSIHLLRQGECLLERLKSLKVSEDNLQGQGWMFKCIFEVEIRLSDIRSLLSYASSLSPFWTHCERQLKRLEGVINDKIYQLAKSTIMDEAEEAPDSFEEKLNIKEVSYNEVKADGALKTIASAPNTSDVSINAALLTVGSSDVNNQVPSINAAAHMIGVPSFGSPTEHCEHDVEEGELVDGGTLSGENSKTGVHTQEDDDMDVDMEVEDVIPPSTVAFSDVPPNPLEQLTPSADYSAVLPPPNEEWIPPPPDTEQIPPPPPDNEEVPPPPPDEPPEHTYPLAPSHTETTPLTYADQYNLTYSDPSYQYYGHAVNQIPVGGFYGHADGSQIAVPQASLYYQPVPNTYSENASVSVNSVEPVMFYDHQGRRVSSVPIAVGTESFQLHSEVGTISSNTIASNQVGFGGDIALAEPGLRADDPTVNEKTEVASVGSSSTFATIEAPATVSVKESFAAAAASVAAATSSSTLKVQSKAARTKKKTVAGTSSLRSNKKVSSLVDKWKAAKEELQENADNEPENAYEILERKRQREIEEWHAQQLASGEAKDNANFQPLGGDWREKVKRRRAKKAKESPDTPSEALADGNQQSDLDELSRGLPSGWQAYWDEASKQVYYGNVNTSKTTWIRPTE
ncbi:hypothetical protein V6N13_142331 [Hibiscus sabdariffa]